MPAPGATFAGYALRRALGQGTAGTVYVAQALADGRWVALKVLHTAAGADDEARAEHRARFLAEVRIAQRLRHPGIVAVLAGGETAGRLWLAMELVAGCALSRYARPHRLLPARAAVDIARAAATALAHAHACGVVHRDIKPGNILVDLPAGIVKVADFGIARLAGTDVTRTGLLLGTPAYMAPEQLAGTPADERGDVYSLGVVLFELLTGRRPHEAPTMGEFLRQVGSAEAPELRQFWPEVPMTLNELVGRALARQPERRPAGAAEFAEALGRARVHMED